MYVLTLVFIFILTSKTVAQAFLDYSINVGTVLFSPSDLHKRHWTKHEIGLLEARQKFQSLLPPPNFMDTANEEYVNTLLRYFRDTYSTIKRETTCPASDSLLTTAFSDAIGGYLQLWVLPISKLAFYGGTISQENIMKLYQFHNEIKRFIGTDGTGWQTPDKSFLNSILTNIAASKHVITGMKNPCDQLAYYEKTANGLMIPTPSIKWGDSSSTMFVPLRNQSMIPLASPNYPNTLFVYYDAAKNCLVASENNEKMFDDRFQSWLNKDVVPHLNDDTVYLPLGNVLSLVNRSCDMYDLNNVYDTKYPKPIRYIAGIPIDFSSKKTLIIAIILFLEIVWCIPALLFILFSKKRNNGKGCNIYTLLFRNNDHDKREKKKKRGFFMSLKKIHQSSHKNLGFKLENKPRNEIVEVKPSSSNFEVQAVYFPDCNSSTAMDNHSYTISRISSTVSVLHETPLREPAPPLKSPMQKISDTPLKSSLKKIQSSGMNSMRQAVTIEPSKSSSKTFFIRKGVKSHESYKTTPKASGAGSFPDSKDANAVSSHEIVEHKGGISNTTHVKSSSNIFRKVSSKKFRQKEETSATLVPEFSYLTCLEAEVGSTTTVVTKEPTKCKCSDKSIEISIEGLKPQVGKPPIDPVSKSVGVKLQSNRPYLEIKIDKPQTEISVGISGPFDQPKIRRSRIPKMLRKGTFAKTVQRTSSTSPMRKNEALAQKNKSLIPQPKRRPVDDIVIKTSNHKQRRKDSKLNVTL